ncbi:MAG TPA: hypothetical protein VGD99_07675, partial [Anaerolineae bacterium]
IYLYHCYCMGLKMSTSSISTAYRQPSYIVDANGQPEAVIIDIAMWQIILEQLEDLVDHEVLHQAAADLEALSKGQRPAGWQSWEAFEAELDALETADELSD